MKTRIQEKFKSLYGVEGELFASAGRINLIGEHTDYNGGYVFPGAIDCGIIAAIKPNGTDRVRAYSLDYDEAAEFGLREEDAPEAAWARYIFGVCRETIKRGGKVAGFDTVFAGDVPLGAGLSSSAALESTFAFALNELNGNGIDKFELAKIGQSTEHNYCGVKCGIMDQFASIFGKKGSLIRLNCKTLEYKYFPFDPKGYRLVLIDSCVPRSGRITPRLNSSLTQSAYGSTKSVRRFPARTSSARSMLSARSRGSLTFATPLKGETTRPWAK